MSELIRLVYASRSTSAPGSTHQGLDSAVARILAKSRRNNAKLGIVGGLLFGDGCFLQCLEGGEREVDALYEKIRTDPRHRDVTILSRTGIARCSFTAWSMKYAPGEEPLRRLLQTLKTVRFDPYGLSQADLAAVVGYMEHEAEAPSSLLIEEAPVPANSGRTRPVSYIDTFESRQPSAGPLPDALSRTGGGGRVKVAIGLLTAIVLFAGAFWYWKA